MKELILAILLVLFTGYSSGSMPLQTSVSAIQNIQKPDKKALAYVDAASDSWKIGEYANTLKYTELGLEICKEHNYPSIKAKLLNERGIAYDYLGDYSEALVNFYQALRIQEKLNDPEMEAYILSNIGLIYSNQDKLQKALDYHTKSLQIRRKIKNTSGISASLNNIAIIYEKQEKYSDAIANYLECIRIDQLINDIRGLGDDYNNIGICYTSLKEYGIALDYFSKALSIRQSMNNPLGVSETLTNIASLYTQQKQYELAKKYFIESLPYSQKIGGKESLKYIYDNLYLIEEKLGDSISAYNYYKLFVAYSDSIDNSESARKQTELELNYKFDKEKEKAKLLQEKRDAQTRIIFIAIGCVLLIISFFSFLLYRKWKLASVQKQIIEDKNKLVQLKNDEILDSITYAKRIQTAILPSSSLLNEVFPNHFVFYQPKDIVAGDFYWLEVSNELIFFAVADCTGHGVPGALMSVVCHNALNRTVKEFNLTNPGVILDKARELIVAELSKSDASVTDGMDISLCVIHKNNNEFYWAGANNPLWIYRHQDNKMDEWKADKQPIGTYWNYTNFNSHKITLDEKDRIYLFTDGFADQFGGNDGKKLKIRAFQNLIFDTAQLSISEQYEAIESFFKNWKGKVEQLDDVCVVGFSLS